MRLRERFGDGLRGGLRKGHKVGHRDGVQKVHVFRFPLPPGDEEEETEGGE